MMAAGGKYKEHMVQAAWVYWPNISPVGPEDLWQRGLPQRSDLEAHDSTFHPLPSGHTGFLLFLKHTKSRPASDRVFSLSLGFSPPGSPCIVILAQLIPLQRGLSDDPKQTLFISLTCHPVYLPSIKAFIMP